MKVRDSAVFTDYMEWIEEGHKYPKRVLPPLFVSMRADAGVRKSDGSGRFRPSLIGDRCNRKQLLSYRGEPQNPDVTAGNWYAWLGTWGHLAFQVYLLTKWHKEMLIEKSVTAGEDGIGVSGTADWFWHGRTVKYDKGTIAGPHYGDYKTIQNIEQVEAGPVRKHVDQVRYELATTGLEIGYLVYQTRPHGQMRTFRLEMEPEDHAKVRARMEILDEHARAGTLPPMLDVCKTFGRTFKSCDFSQVCLARHAASEEGDAQ